MKSKIFRANSSDLHKPIAPKSNLKKTKYDKIRESFGLSNIKQVKSGEDHTLLWDIKRRKESISKDKDYFQETTKREESLDRSER